MNYHEVYAARSQIKLYNLSGLNFISFIHCGSRVIPISTESWLHGDFYQHRSFSIDIIISKIQNLRAIKDTGLPFLSLDLEPVL